MSTSAPRVARGDKYARVRSENRARYSRPPTVRGATATSPAGSATGRIPSSCQREGRKRASCARRAASVVYLKRAKGYSSYAGEISDAPDNLVERRLPRRRPEQALAVRHRRVRAPVRRECYLSPGHRLLRRDALVVVVDRAASPDAAPRELEPAEGACAARLPGRAPGLPLGPGLPLPLAGAGSGYARRNGLVRSHVRRRAAARTTRPCEGFFGRLKNEFFYYRDWRRRYRGGVHGDARCLPRASTTRAASRSRSGWMSPMQYRRSLGLAA